MKKWFIMLLFLGMMLGTAACGADRQEGLYTSEGGREQQKPDAEIVLAEEHIPMENESVNPTENQILIAYFTWADNTVVDDDEAAVESALSHYESVGDSYNYSGIDATTSASVLPPGNTAQMAEWIQQRVGGDLLSIIVTEPYSSDYDVVFLGYPNWWYTAPMAVFSFIEEYDLADKTIVPFCAHGTGGLAGSVRDITAALPDSAKVMEPLGVIGRTSVRHSR